MNIDDNERMLLSPYASRSSKNIQQAFEDWLAAKASGWRSLAAVTLTLKQAIPAPDGGLASITIEDCRRTMQRFGRELDKRIYGRSARRHRRKLNKLFVLERSHNSRWHYHGAIEPPPDMPPDEFSRHIRECWTSTDWGYDQIDIQPNADLGWITYSLKPRTKEALDFWADGIEVVAK